MEISLDALFEARRARLAVWVTTHYGRPKDFVKMTGFNQGLLSALIKKDSSKSFGEKIALNIEALASSVQGKHPMPTGYLLNPFSGSHVMRLDPRILKEAIETAADSRGGATAKKIAVAYDLLMARAAGSTVSPIQPMQQADSRPPRTMDRESEHRGSPGTVQDIGRPRRERAKQ